MHISCKLNGKKTHGIVYGMDGHVFLNNFWPLDPKSTIWSLAFGKKQKAFIKRFMPQRHAT